MTNPKRSRWLLWLIPALPLGFILACYIAFLSLCTYVAVDGIYDRYQFDGARGTYYQVFTRLPASCELYVDLPGQGPIAVGEITEEMVKGKSTLLDPREGSDVREYIGDFGRFEFRSDKIVSVELNGDKLPFSNRPEGPWLRFPVRYADVHKVFGPPKRTVSTREQERMPPFH
jgi:hypothetical protein